mgnify:FL=1
MSIPAPDSIRVLLVLLVGITLILNQYGLIGPRWLRDRMRRLIKWESRDASLFFATDPYQSPKEAIKEGIHKFFPARRRVKHFFYYLVYTMVSVIIIIILTLIALFILYSVNPDFQLLPSSYEADKNWKTLEMEGLLIHYPPHLKYCGDTEGIPLCIDDKQAFWFGEWFYRGPSEEETFGSCGLNLDECKLFFAKDGSLSERTVNGLKGFEVVEDISRESIAQHLIFDNARVFYVEKPDKSGLIAIDQRKRSTDLDDVYEGILKTLRFGDYHFNAQQLGI